MTSETSILPLAIGFASARSAIAMLQFPMSQNQATEQLIYEGLKNSQQSN